MAVVPFSPRSAAAAKIDPIAATWGGLAGAIGLMVGAGRDWPARLLALAIAFGLAGFLAGVRAMGRRIAHGFAAFAVAYAIHAAFIALANVIDMFGGPVAPALLAGGGSAWLRALGASLAFALIGAVLANRWLAPPGGRRR
ncbi:MAG: hypothetical protein RIB67_04670 [Miltoncostaeaceae bacterium]